MAEEQNGVSGAASASWSQWGATHSAPWRRYRSKRGQQAAFGQ